MSGQSRPEPRKPVLSKSLEKLFLPIIKMRGESYARQNRVQIKEMNEGRVAATVRGTRQYRVTLSWSRRDPTRIKTSCTCPFFRQGIPCKHLWATILVADEGRWMPRSTELPELSDPLELFSEKYWSKEQTTPSPLPSFAPQSFILWFTLKHDPMGYFITVCERYVKKDGSFGRIRPLQHRSSDPARRTRQDRLLIPLIEECLARNHIYGRPGMTKRLEYVPVTSRELDVMLPLLAETGRFSLEDAVSGIEITAISMAEEPDAQLRIDVALEGTESIESDDGLLRLRPRIILCDEDGRQRAIGLSEPIHFFDTEPVYFIHRQRLFALHGPRLQAVRALMHAEETGGGLRVARKRLPELIRRQRAVSGRDIFRFSKEVAPRCLDGASPVLKLYLELKANSIECRAFFVYEGAEIPAKGLDEGPEHFDPERWMIVRRDRKKEDELLGLLSRAGIELDHDGRAEIGLDSAAQVLDDLDRSGIILEAKGRKRFVPGKISRFSVKSGIDWFDLHGSVDFGGESVSLPGLLEAYLKGESTIRLNSGDVGIVPSKWIEKNLDLLRLGLTGTKKGGKGLRFRSSQALLIGHLLDEARCVKDLDEEFAQRLRRLKSFSGIQRIEPPPEFRGHLRDYQKEALGWFKFLEELRLGGILADDMGLGKTVQVLAWLASRPGTRPDAPSLVVAPTSLLFNWINEASKFTPGLRVLNYAGIKRRKGLKALSDHDLVVTSYGIMRRDIEFLRGVKFNYVILDESQAIKNPDSISSKAASLLDGAHRLCLTGTPLENHVGELWSQMEFLNPGLLGPRESFFNAYVRPVNSGNRDPLETLKRLVRPFILRRTKEEVASELPPKVEKLIMCPMTPDQEDIYLRLREHYRAAIAEAMERQGANKSRFKVLEGLLRLRQAANHPKLVGMDAGSGKFERLMNLIKEAVDSGHKALIFSQFTKMLGLIRQELDRYAMAYAYLDGRTPQKKREEMVNRFQEDRGLRLFLISLRAGGFGLNLTAADYVFIVDPWWNPAVELQAIDRSHRIGQSKTVVTYRLISKGTVEEKVMGLQKKKRRIAGSVLSGSKDMLSRLSPRDLEILFS